MLIDGARAGMPERLACVHMQRNVLKASGGVLLIGVSALLYWRATVQIRENALSAQAQWAQYKTPAGVAPTLKFQYPAAWRISRYDAWPDGDYDLILGTGGRDYSIDMHYWNSAQTAICQEPAECAARYHFIAATETHTTVGGSPCIEGLFTPAAGATTDQSLAGAIFVVLDRFHGLMISYNPDDPESQKLPQILASMSFTR